MQFSLKAQKGQTGRKVFSQPHNNPIHSHYIRIFATLKLRLKLRNIMPCNLPGTAAGVGHLGE